MPKQPNAPNAGKAPDASTARQLPENCVEYVLLVLGGQQHDVRATRLRLEAVRRAAVWLSQALAKDYIWQRDDFRIELKSQDGLLCLHGVTDHGDAIEDEWLIVYMLRELTKSHPDLWVRAADSDGEFLLVEAANAVPQWLSPEIDHCRVWMHQGKLLLIPLPDESQAPSACPGSSLLSLSQAVDFINCKPNALIHSALIETEAFYRLGKYPKQVADSIHHSLVTVPRKLAYILHSLPRSVAPAVERFYLRSAIALKPVQSSSGPLVFPPEDLVTISIRFSRVLFAQAKSQRFDAPPRWAALLRDTPGGKALSDQASKQREKLELGMKLTCGFEMLATNAETNKSRVVREMVIMLEDLEEDGEVALPSDKEIASWRDALRDDDESWLDINYEDFEHELKGGRAHSFTKGKSGFGDAQTQADLRKIVSRFEIFLNDEKAGLEGAQLDSMDFDDDDNDNDGDEEEDDDDDETELDDKEVRFDEEAFSRMMREMMGPPPTEPQEFQMKTKDRARENHNDAHNSTISAEDEGSEIKELSSMMEAELKGYGALKLDVPHADRHPKLNNSAENQQPRRQCGQGSRTEYTEDSEEEIDIDYNLVKNLLESFKSQGGMAGPVGSLMGLMGFQLPRDEDDGDDDRDASQTTTPAITDSQI